MVAKVIKRGKLSMAETVEALDRASKREHLLYQVLRDFLEMRPYKYTPPIKTIGGGAELRASVHQPLSPSGGYVVIMFKSPMIERLQEIEYLEEWLARTAILLRALKLNDPEREVIHLLWSAVREIQQEAIDREKRDKALGEARG